MSAKNEFKHQLLIVNVGFNLDRIMYAGPQV